MFKKKIFLFTLLVAAIQFSTGAAFASDGVNHTVKKGEYLWLIAVSYGVPVQEIIDANQLLNPELIYPEQKIWVPQAKTEAPQQVSRSKTRIAWTDIELMARVVMAESRGEPYKGQVGVAAVILNRLKDQRFPKTISGIIYEPYAFQPVDNGSLWWDYPSEQQFDAVRDAINGNVPTYGAVFFATYWSPFIWTKNETIQIGNHVFAR
jgi:N-acetylmuramoyl-L-alanine amidase